MYSKWLLSRLRHRSAFFHLTRSIHVAIQSPISLRKIMITCCQVMDVDERDFSFTPLPHIIDIHTHTRIKLHEFYHSLHHTVSSPIQGSFLWMFLRTCPEPPSNDESESIRQLGFEKEFEASQTLFNDHQTVSYSAFFRDQPGVNDPGRWWIQQAHEIRDTFTRSMKDKVLFPQVNRNKNVSDETKLAMNQFREMDYVRTVDLEIFYHQTGIRLSGNCEVRDAWKFNDLKPRMYYCIGGQQYWTSSYVKVIAVKIMEAIPSTFVKIRISPTQFLNANDDDYTVAWDFTSFTTTLFELKYFIWYVARMVERANTTVTLFDYREGFIQRPLHELIDEYNVAANLHAPFEIHRMVGRFIEGSQITMFQQNSGMLGVAGNIGFSTALHGLVVCKECGAHRCVCVGDDALGLTPVDPSESLVPALQQLGVIHPEKFGILSPDDKTGRYIKFLKRRFEKTGSTYTISHLFNFPITPYIDGESGHRTIPPDFSYEARVFKVCSAVASLLWEVKEHPHLLDDDDLDILFVILEQTYRYMTLPLAGALPGVRIRFGGMTEDAPMELGFSIPAITPRFDPRKEDWVDVLIRYSPQMFFRGPTYIPHTPDVHWTQGMEGLRSESVYLSALEDIGFVKLTPVSEWFQVSGVSSARVLRRMVRKVDDGMVKAIHVHCLKDVPDSFVNAVHEVEDLSGLDTIMEDF